MTRKKLLLLGAGPTSSLIAYNLRTSTRLRDYEFDIHVWEKSRGVGGRFTTSRNPNNPSSQGDLGAQYFTWSAKDFSKSYFNNLIEHKLIREFDTLNIPGFRQDATKTNYVCTMGTASIVKHFFDQAVTSDRNKITFAFDKIVTGISTPNSSDSTTSITVSSEDGTRENFDIVITTLPVPQLLELENIKEILAENPSLKSELEKVRYTSRFALGLFYDSKTGPFTNLDTIQPIHFSNDPIIRYWSVENKKRGKEDHEPCTIVAHTSVSYGAENIDKSPQTVKDFLLEKVSKQFNNGEEGSPDFVKCHKWKYSQVDTPFVGQPGFVEVAKNIIAAGDGFVGSGIEGCITSAEKTVQYLESII